MDTIIAIAEMIFDDPWQNYSEHICYHFNVTPEWLCANAKEICETLMTMFDAEYAEYVDGYFFAYYHKPNLYVFVHHRSQIVGVVQAWDIDDAKRKIPCEYDTLELVDGDVYYDQY